MQAEKLNPPAPLSEFFVSEIYRQLAVCTSDFKTSPTSAGI